MYLSPLFNVFSQSKTYKILFNTNKKYIKSLSKSKQTLLKLFSKGYDKNLSGLQNRNIPINDEIIPITKARNMLTDIIEKSPKLKEDIVVFRGKESRKTLRGFPSYSLDPSIADNFARGMSFDKKGVLEIIHIKKGTPVLFIEPITEYPGEYEVLIPQSILKMKLKDPNQHSLQVFKIF